MQSWIVAGSLLLFLTDISLCQTPSTRLTLQDCIRLAQTAPSSVRLARQQIDIAEHGIRQARANFLPQISIANTFTYNSLLPGGNFSFVSLNGLREYYSAATSTVELDTSGRLRAILGRARADRDVARADLILNQRDLRRTVAASYYRLLLAHRIVDVAKRALDEAISFESRARILFESGETAQADVVKASAQVAFLREAAQAAELESRLANHDLASFWTTDVAAPLTIEDVLDEPIPPLPAEISPAGSYLKRVELQILGAQLRGFQADARRFRADLLPQLGVTYQYGVDSLQLQWRDRGSAVFAHLNIPVFDWFKARSAIRQAQIQGQQVGTNRDIFQRRFSKEYQDVVARIQIVYSQIAQTGEQVRLSEDNLRLTRVRYEGGEGSALDVVTAQSQLAQARANYYNARIGYLNAQADLEVVSGR